MATAADYKKRLKAIADAAAQTFHDHAGKTNVQGEPFNFGPAAKALAQEAYALGVAASKSLGLPEANVKLDDDD
jgi:hypothetical protein